MGKLVDYEAVLLARLLRRMPLERALSHLTERPPRILGHPPVEALDWDSVSLKDTIERAYRKEHTELSGYISHVEAQ